VNLLDLVNRTPAASPWEEGEKIPWDDPAFSARMLSEHFSPALDAASHQRGLIDAHVRRIHRVVSGGPLTRACAWRKRPALT
jgi:hypothetical protein